VEQLTEARMKGYRTCVLSIVQEATLWFRFQTMKLTQIWEIHSRRAKSV